MIAPNSMQMKLEGIYYKLLTDELCSGYERLLHKLVAKLCDVINSAHGAFYAYNTCKDRYDLKAANKKDGLFKSVAALNRIVKYSDNCDLMDSSFFCNFEISDNVALIPLSASGESYFFLVFTLPQSSYPDKEFLEIIRRKTEQFLSQIHKYYEEQKRAAYNKILLDFSSKIFMQTNRDEIIKQIISEIELRYPSHSFYVLLSHDYNADDSLPVKTIKYSNGSTNRIITQAFLSGRTLLEDNVQEKSAYIYAPLRGEQGVYGVLQIKLPYTASNQENEISFIDELASIAGKAIENVSRYQYSTHLVADLKLINEVTQQINSNLDLNEIISIVKRQIMSASGALEVGFINVHEKATSVFSVYAGSSSYFNTKNGMLFTEYMVNKMLRSPDPVFTGEFNQEAFPLPYQSVMAIPMIQNETLYGLVIVLHEKTYFFSYDNFRLIQSLMQHLQLALTNSHLKSELEKSVITDYLTGLYSRNHLDESLKAHMEEGEKGVLILFDIDDFKKVNDTYGHYIGDEVIIQIASIMRTYLNNGDIAARWGGEELAIYLPEASMDYGLELAGKIRMHTEKSTEPRVTLSCGVSCWISKTKDCVNDVFQRADQALYEAKNIGKNCVIRR